MVLLAPSGAKLSNSRRKIGIFGLAKYRDWLLRFLDAHTACVSPAFRQQELRNAAEKLSGDLSISRPKSRLAWGIELPFDSSCVTYVWFDALVNYISFAGYLQDDAAFRERWPALHVIGKDILIPAHGIYWLAMLKAMGFADEEMPTFLVHGYVLVDGDKMSKSLGNIRDPNTFADNFGVEALRYYLMRDCVVGQDMDFTDQRLIQRFNSDLANGLGNLVNRTLTMTHRYRYGRLSRSLQNGLRDRAIFATKAYTEAMEDRSINLALEKVAELVTEANQFVERSAPWKLAREASNEARLDAIFYHLAEVIRLIAIMISPVLPRPAADILRQLNWGGPLKLTEMSWGILPEGHQLEKPVPVFPRIEATAKED